MTFPRRSIGQVIEARNVVLISGALFKTWCRCIQIDKVARFCMWIFGILIRFIQSLFTSVAAIWLAVCYKGGSPHCLKKCVTAKTRHVIITCRHVAGRFWQSTHWVRSWQWIHRCPANNEYRSCLVHTLDWKFSMIAFQGFPRHSLPKNFFFFYQYHHLLYSLYQIIRSYS